MKTTRRENIYTSTKSGREKKTCNDNGEARIHRCFSAKRRSSHNVRLSLVLTGGPE
jgi:NCAIR mutase (PurE)-related protein